jgi:hypothetical protein
MDVDDEQQQHTTQKQLTFEFTDKNSRITSKYTSQQRLWLFLDIAACLLSGLAQVEL